MKKEIRRRAILLFVVIAAALGVATSSAIAAISGGSTTAWGYNNHGQLGNDSTTPSNAPTPVSSLSSSDVKSVSAGYQYSLALKNDGTVWAWGNNDNGQLGNNPTSTPESHVPVQVKDPNDPRGTGFLQDVIVIAVSAGEGHSLALKSDGTVWAWGWNYHGELGNGSATTSSPVLASPLPVAVSNLSGVTAIASGPSARHSLAIKSGGSIMAWGYNNHGQLGNGGNYYTGCTCIDVPVAVSGLSGATSISAGGDHSLAN